MSDSESIVSPGTVLAERYRLTKEIGRGGFGMVYLARQLNMDRDVAIKILPPKFMSISDVVERFRREARLASRLRHPNTITVHDYGKQDNLLFIVMEFLEGEDLADVLMRRATVPMDRILHIGRQVLKSLHEAHQHKIVHRDLKPENIFLTQVGGEEDYVKVLDFGIAKLAMPEVKAGDKAQRKLTMSGSTVGTPTYMSPEQAAGEEVDALTDLYALGIILYEMACGRPPFRDDNPIKVMRSHLFEEVPRFPDGPLRDSRFEWIIRKALAKEREERFNSAKEFLNALDVTPTAMLERADQGEEPPTIELPDLELSADNLDSKDLAFERTAAYEVEGSDALSLRSTHQTDADLAAQDSSVAETGESVPFESIPQGRKRDKVHQGASTSGLNDGSGLTSRSGLNERSSPPPGFETGASTSSILTVLEPGPEEDVILLTNKKDEAGAPEDVEASPAESSLGEQFDSEATPNEVVQTGPNRVLRNQTGPSQTQPSSPQRTRPGRDNVGPTLRTSSQQSRADVPPDGHSENATPRGSEWSWGGDKRRDAHAAKAGQTGTDALDLEEYPVGRTGTQKALLALLFIVIAAAASASYLHFGGHVDLLGLF